MVDEASKQDQERLAALQLMKDEANELSRQKTEAEHTAAEVKEKVAAKA